MKISIISDEISQDPYAAVYIGSQHLGIHQYELRVIMGNRVPDIGDQYVQQLQEIKNRYDVQFSAIAAGLFKCLPTDEALREQYERLEKAIALAKTLNIKTITGFALHDTDNHRSEEFRALMIPHFKKVVERVQEHGITFAVETEYMTGVESAKDARALVDAVPGLKVNWDPANCWVAGEDPLEGYPHIQGFIANIHCKDADTHEWRKRNPFVAFGDGLVPWEKLIPILMRDPNIERLTVETHIDPVIPKSEKSVARLRSLLNSYYWVQHLAKEEK